MSAMGGNVVPFRRKDDNVQVTVPGGPDPALDLAAELNLLVGRSTPGHTVQPDIIARELLRGMSQRGWVLMRASDV